MGYDVIICLMVLLSVMTTVCLLNCLTFIDNQWCREFLDVLAYRFGYIPLMFGSIFVIPLVIILVDTYIKVNRKMLIIKLNSVQGN